MWIAIRLLGFLLVWFAAGPALAANAAAPAGAASGGSQARLYAAIDLGSRGVKAFLYSFIPAADGLESRILFQSDIRTTLVSGADKNRFTEAGIVEASRAVAELTRALKAEVAKSRQEAIYYIVGSSGIAAFDNRDELKQAVEQASGIRMGFVSAAQEARFAALAAIPRKRRPVGVAVDIGSGNTKIGCIDGARTETHEISYGTVKLRKAAMESAPSESGFVPAVERILAADVQPAVRGCALDRNHVYWLGGAAWATATFMHPEAALWGYVPLTLADIDGFLKRLKDDKWNKEADVRIMFAPSVSAAQRQAISTRAAADRRAVMDVFSREDLIAGVSIMKAIVQASAQPAEVKQFFRRDGNYLFGWALDRFRPEPLEQSGPTYFAGIDLGSRGVKAFIYSFHREGEGLDARIQFRDSVNTKLATSAVDNSFLPAGIEEATRAVVQLLGKMQQYAAQQNIEPRYYLVASSGVGSFANHQELKTAVEKATDLPVEFIDARTEARHALRSAVPEQRVQDSVIVDVGSNNTKLGCMSGSVMHTDELPYGTQKLRTLVPEGKPYESGLDEVLATVSASYRKIRMNTPCYGNRNRIYFVGGAPWALTTFMRADAVRLGWVQFSTADTEAFIDQLRTGRWNQAEPAFTFAPTVPAPTRIAVREENAAARAEVQNVFAREDLLAGASLVGIIQRNANKSAQFYFVRNGNYLFGYAVEKFNDWTASESADAKPQR